MRLSEHLTLDELIASETASRHGLDNTPPSDVVDRLRLLCTTVLEPVRAHFGPIHINSGYRSLEVNRRVGSKDAINNTQYILSNHEYHGINSHDEKIRHNWPRIWVFDRIKSNRVSQRPFNMDFQMRLWERTQKHIESCKERENEKLWMHEIRKHFTKEKDSWDTSKKLYNIWKSIRSRCNSTSNTRYKDYGGRGISISEEFKNYPFFKNWALKNGYVDGLSIDRIDNNGNYCEENCRVVTMQRQANNTRRNRLIKVGSELMSMADASRKVGIPYSRLRARIYLYGMTDDQALYSPLNVRLKIKNETTSTTPQP